MNRAMALACLAAALGAATGCGSDGENNNTALLTTDGGSDAGEGGVHPDGPIAVNGRIFDVSGRMPFVHVWIPGHEAATTDGEGQFHFDDVKAPYDLFVLRQSTELVDGVVYQHVTRADPTIVFSTPKQGDVRHSSSVAGTGAFAQSPNGNFMSVAFDSPEQPTTTPTGNADGTYSIAAQWFGPVTTTGSVYGLHFGNEPASFFDFGAIHDITLTDQAAATGKDVNLAALAMGKVEGTIVPAPTGFTLASYAVYMAVGAHGLLPFVYKATPAAGPISQVTPVVPGNLIMLSVSAQNGPQQTWLRKSVNPNATGVNLALPTPPELVTPDIDATDVSPTTPLVWKGEATGVSTVDVTVNDPQIHFRIVTADTRTTLPDLSSLGVSFPKGATFTWTVSQCTPTGAVDDILDGERDPNPRCEGIANSLTRQAKTTP